MSLVVYSGLECYVPFRGLLTDEMAETIQEVGFRHYIMAWLPTWWFILACSMMSAGVGLGCSFWAIVQEVHGQPIGVPVLIGAGSLVSAFAGLVVPITLAWFKDRSESRKVRHLIERVKLLEKQVEFNRIGHVENASNIHKVTIATQKIADAAEKILEVKEHSRRAVDDK